MTAQDAVEDPQEVLPVELLRIGLVKVILPHRVFLDIPGDAPDLGPEGNAIRRLGELLLELRGVFAQDPEV